MEKICPKCNHINRIDLEPPQGRTRKERADQKIDPAPFLPSIRVHLYK